MKIFKKTSLKMSGLLLLFGCGMQASWKFWQTKPELTKAREIAASLALHPVDLKDGLRKILTDPANNNLKTDQKQALWQDWRKEEYLFKQMPIEQWKKLNISELEEVAKTWLDIWIENLELNSNDTTGVNAHVLEKFKEQLECFMSDFHAILSSDEMLRLVTEKGYPVMPSDLQLRIMSKRKRSHLAENPGIFGEYYVRGFFERQLHDVAKSAAKEFEHSDIGRFGGRHVRH